MLYRSGPRDPTARAELVVDMLTGESPNDKEQVLAPLREPQEPTEHAKAANKTRAASQTAAPRSEVAGKAAAARLGSGWLGP